MSTEKQAVIPAKPALDETPLSERIFESVALTGLMLNTAAIPTFTFGETSVAATLYLAPKVMKNLYGISRSVWKATQTSALDNRNSDMLHDRNGGRNE